MLTISVALHAIAAGGLVITHYCANTTPLLTSTAVDSPSIILLSSVETPNFQQHLSAKRTPTNPVLTSMPTAVPLPAQSVDSKEVSVAAPAPSLALEANPNAHLRSVPPEMILSPAHAPHLDGSNGVVFILDVSGSMYESYAGTTRLALARETLCQQIRAMKDGTPFAITLYAEHAYTSGPLVAASDVTRDAAIRFIMRDVNCGGGTDLPAGLASATELKTGLLVLVSDGDLNISAVKLLTKAQAILGSEKHGPSLSIIAVAPRPNTPAKQLLQGLANQEGGGYRALQVNTDASLLTATATKTDLTTP